MPERKPVIPPELVEQILDALSDEGMQPPSAELKSRIMKAVAKDEARRQAVTVRGEEGLWAALLEGVEIKVLRDDGRTCTWLARMQKGATLPAHEHPGDEECFVIEGSIDIGGERFHAGDYQVARAGTRHGVLASPTGCVLLLRSPSRPAAPA